MRAYLQIKNFLISLILSVMFYGWIVDTESLASKIFTSIVVFFCMMVLLMAGDEAYLERRREIRKARKDTQARQAGASREQE